MILAYDVETFKDLTTAIFKNVDDPTQSWEFAITADGSRNDVAALSEFLRGGWRDGHIGDLTLVGHNSLAFDDVILRAILAYPNIKPINLWRLAGKLIDRDFEGIPGYNELRYPKVPLWHSIDTLAVTRVNQIRVSLKHAGVVLRHRRLQELPYAPDQPLTSAQMAEIIDYNYNDVDITIKLYHALKALFQQRHEIGELFGVDVVSANDTEIAKEILDKLYREAVGAADFKKIQQGEGTPRFQIAVKDCIGASVRFDTPELQALYDDIAGRILFEPQNYRYKANIVFGDTEYRLGVGGLHSNDAPGAFSEEPGCEIIDADVTSYYPNIMLKNRFVPAHLGPTFLELYSHIVDERIAAKYLGSQGDRVAATKAQTLKIAINSVFGLMGNRYYWLYDPKVLISITITGQLLLLDLIEKLHLGGIQTISANTDGIICKVPHNLRTVYDQTCAAWAARTDFDLEFTPYRRYIRRDVNNYITVKANGKVKTKGIFEGQFYANGHFYNLTHYNAFAGGDLSGLQPEVPGLQKGYDAPVVTFALYQYFIHGVPVTQTIRAHPDVRDFAIAKRVTKSKFKEVCLESPITRRLTVVPHYNRYIVVERGGGNLVKIRFDNSRISALAGKQVQLVNDLESSKKEQYDLDYQYYIGRALKIIDLIEPKQRTLW